MTRDERLALFGGRTHILLKKFLGEALRYSFRKWHLSENQFTCIQLVNCFFHPQSELDYRGSFPQFLDEFYTVIPAWEAGAYGDVFTISLNDDSRVHTGVHLGSGLVFDRQGMLGPYIRSVGTMFSRNPAEYNDYLVHRRKPDVVYPPLSD